MRDTVESCLAKREGSEPSICSHEGLVARQGKSRNFGKLSCLERMGERKGKPSHSFRIVWVLALCYGIEKEKYPISEHPQDDLLTILYITFWDGECRQVSFLRVRW